MRNVHERRDIQRQFTYTNATSQSASRPYTSRRDETGRPTQRPLNLNRCLGDILSSRPQLRLRQVDELQRDFGGYGDGGAADSRLCRGGGREALGRGKRRGEEDGQGTLLQGGPRELAEAALGKGTRHGDGNWGLVVRRWFGSPMRTKSIARPCSPDRVSLGHVMDGYTSSGWETLHVDAVECEA